MTVVTNCLARIPGLQLCCLGLYQLPACYCCPLQLALSIVTTSHKVAR